MTPGLRASSSLILKTIFIRSEPMSAILVKMPPAIRSAAAPNDSPMAKPIEHRPAKSPRTNNNMQSNAAKSFDALDRIPRQQATLAKLDSGKLDGCLAKQDESEVRASLREAQ